jgi:hypothetical protein
MKPKRAKPFNATAASIKKMEAEGWTCWVVESRIPHTFVTRDCYRFADVLLMSPSKGIMLIQATGGAGKSNFNARVSKVKAEPLHAIWLASGGRIQVQSWEGKGKIRECRVLEITL